MWVHVKWGVTIIVKIEVAEAKTCSLLSPRMSLRCWNLNSASTVRLSGPCLLNQQIFQPCLYMADLCYKFEVKRLNLLHLRQLFIEHLENSSTQSTNLMECYVSGAPLCGNTRELTDTWTMIDSQTGVKHDWMMDSSSFLYRLMNLFIHNYTVCVNNTYCSRCPLSWRCWVHWEPAAVQLCCYSWCCCLMRLEAVTRKASLPPICSHSLCVCVCVLEHIITPCVLSPPEGHGTGKIIITYNNIKSPNQICPLLFFLHCAHIEAICFQLGHNELLFIWWILRVFRHSKDHLIPEITLRHLCWFSDDSRGLSSVCLRRIMWVCGCFSCVIRHEWGIDVSVSEH